MENKDYIIAIDLGTNSVVTLVGMKAAEGKVKIVDSAVAQVEGVIRGEIKNIDTVAKSIKQTIDEIESRMGIKIFEAYVGISGQHIRCVKQPYYVFVGSDGEIREEDVQKLHDGMRNVQAPDGEKIIQILLQNYIVDDQEEVVNPVGTFGKKLEANFNFVIGDNNTIIRIERALSRINIKQAGMFLNPVASSCAVVTQDEKDEGVAVVDIGAGTTDITIYYKNVVRHIGVVPMGGNAINKDIRSCGILERHIENLKIKHGCAMRDSVQNDQIIRTPGLNPRVPKDISFLNLATIIEARMLDIMDLVIAEIKASGYADKLGAGIVITGGAAQLKDLDKLIRNYTGYDVRVGTPLILVSEDSMELADNPALATAVGIVATAIQNGKCVRVERTTLDPSRSRPLYDQTRANQQQQHSGSVANNQQPDYSDEQNDDDQDQNGSQRKEKKGGFFGKLKDTIDNMFNVVEGDEI